MPSDTLAGSGGMRTSRDQLWYCRMVACTAASKVNLREMRKYSGLVACDAVSEEVHDILPRDRCLPAGAARRSGRV
eukprot:2878911-Prymnesium_polylepis.1